MLVKGARGCWWTLVWLYITDAGKPRLSRNHRIQGFKPQGCSHRMNRRKVHGSNMGSTWVLSAPDGPHVGPMNLLIRVCCYSSSYISILLSTAAGFSTKLYFSPPLIWPSPFLQSPFVFARRLLFLEALLLSPDVWTALVSHPATLSSLCQWPRSIHTHRTDALLSLQNTIVFTFSL